MRKLTAFVLVIVCVFVFAACSTENTTGMITIYSEATSEDADAVAKTTVVLSTKQIKQIKKIIDNVQNWQDDSTIDRAPFSFDGEIKFSDSSFVYRFGFVQNVLYYDHFFAEISSAEMQQIRDICTNLNHLVYVDPIPLDTQLKMEIKASESPDLTLPQDQAKVLIQLWNDSSWEIGITKTAYDYVFRGNKVHIRYCCDAGIFNDVLNDRHTYLTDEIKAQVNQMLDNSDTPTTPSTPAEPEYAYQPADIPKTFWPVLNSIQPFEMFGKKMYLDSYIFAQMQVKITHCADVDYTLLTNDKNQVMLAITDDFDTLVLYVADGKVYGRGYSFRSLYDLCTNGTYTWNYTNADGHHYGQGRIYFDTAEIKDETLWQVSNDGQDDVRYLIGGKEVTKTQLQEYADINAGTEASWSPVYRFPTVVDDITKLSLDRACVFAVNQYEKHPDSHRDIGQLQPKTVEIVEMAGKYYQSYVADNADIRYVFVSKAEFPKLVRSDWDWCTVGTTDDYSLDQIKGIN